MSNDYENKKTKIKEFLNKENVKVQISKDNTTTNKKFEKGQYSNAYKVAFIKDNEKAIITYHDSIYNTQNSKDKPTAEDVLYAFKMDNDSFENAPTEKEFVDEFGYEGKEGKKVFEGVKRNSDKFNKIFNEEEKQELNKLYKDY